MQPGERWACSLLWMEQFVTGGEQCITPVTGSAYRKAWDWPAAICVCRLGEGRKEVGRFASLWLVYLWAPEEEKRRECVKTPQITPRKLVASCCWWLVTVKYNSCEYLIQSDLHTLVFTTVALDMECFSQIQATLIRGRNCWAKAALFTQPCLGSDASHYTGLNGFLVCMNSSVRRGGGRRKSMFPLHGFKLIFIGALHTESTNVSENGLDICSHSPLFLSLHPSFFCFSSSFFCSLSSEARCLLLPDTNKKKEKNKQTNDRVSGALSCYSFKLLIN